MKRDLDLVREILFQAASEPGGYASANPKIEGFTADQIAHHIYLMKQAGLVEASNTSAAGGSSPTAILSSVTWEGHDFLEAARSTSLWAQVKEKIKSTGGSATFDLVKELLVAGARAQLGLS